MSAICFLDNDAILKLTACNLLAEAMLCLGVERADVYVLESAQHVFRSNQRLRRNYSEQTCNLAIEFVLGCQVITPPTDLSELDLLNQIVNIDRGEALLISATANVDVFWLTTGDKRCINAVASSGLEEIERRLAGRVICLEQVILKLIDREGFELVRDRVIPGRDCDKVLKSAFGSGRYAEQKNVVETLESYVLDLRNSSQGLLANF